MPLTDVQRADAKPTPRETPKRGTDQRPGESAKAYELRKAMESTEGGDTRRDKSRY
jgi:hypothetical protein